MVRQRICLFLLLFNASLLHAAEYEAQRVQSRSPGMLQQAMMQAMRTNKRFRTVVGDVKGNDDFELKVLRKENP